MILTRTSGFTLVDGGCVSRYIFLAAPGLGVYSTNLGSTFLAEECLAVQYFLLPRQQLRVFSPSLDVHRITRFIYKGAHSRQLFNPDTKLPHSSSDASLQKTRHSRHSPLLTPPWHHPPDDGHPTPCRRQSSGSAACPSSTPAGHSRSNRQSARASNAPSRARRGTSTPP